MERKALVITPSFFGYESDIVAEIERQGYSATLLDERPTNSALGRAIMRVRKDMIGRSITSYYREKCAEIFKHNFDVVLVIKGEVVPEWFLTDVRNANPDATFVFYTYDSIRNSSNWLGIQHLFDVRFSFDRTDVESNDHLDYLPLFYTSHFRPLDREAAAERAYSAAFVGTLHSDRYRLVKAITSNMAGVFNFFYVQARWYFFLTKYLTRENKDVPWRDISFQSLSKSEIAEIFRQSRVVIDIKRDGQSGLTMRTFEVLASGAILATTNQSITKEPFYDPNRVLVLTEGSELGSLLGSLVGNGPPVGFEEYSLSAWVGKILASVEWQER